MPEVDSASVDLSVTSPPYWHIKDYSAEGQIGFGQTLHEYLKDLYRVWSECFRALRPGARLCVNIGDQFARAIIYGRYKVIPLHAEIIAQCERIGFDFMGSIIWQKKTTMNTTGGASVMGSFPYPPNGIVEIDYEFIHIFKKPGPPKRVSSEIRAASKLSTAEWKEFFSGHWHFGGAKQVNHEAMFPEELPARLIKMFSLVGDTVLDPFLGSGTTAKAAVATGRNAVGYEINEGFSDVIREKLGIKGALPGMANNVEIICRKAAPSAFPSAQGYTPGIQDAEPKIDPSKFNLKGRRLYKVTEVAAPNALRLNTGLTVTLSGIVVEKEEEALRYLRNFVLGKEVSLKLDDCTAPEGDSVEACVYLKNRIFINAYMVKSGLASPDLKSRGRLREKFAALWQERNAGG